MQRPVRLSVCIPTHHGRCAVLEEALESIAAQVTPDLPAQIEIVVSDNASTDGTEAMVSAFSDRSAEVEVRYARNERDLRLANIMLSVERASGDWCWLFGSDDVMAGDALAAVIATIRAHPDTTGIGIARTNFDLQMRRRLQADPPETAPEARETTVIEGYAEIEKALAFQHGFLSTNIVRRDLWLAAASDVADDALQRHVDWPHLLVLAEMARRDPTWVWLPTVLVCVRTGRPYIVGGGEGPPNLARMHVLLVAGLRPAWRDVAGEDHALYQALMERTFRVVANGDVVRNIKLSRGHDLTWDLRLASVFARAFWWHGPFWREIAPLLVLTSPVYRALRVRREGRWGTMPVLAPEACSVTVSAQLPERWWAREMPLVPCHVRNTGPIALRSSGEHPIHIGGRWFGPGGKLVMETVRDPLPASLQPGEELEVLVRAQTPWDAGSYRLELGCVQENVRWFSEVDPSSSLTAQVELELAGAAGHLR